MIISVIVTLILSIDNKASFVGGGELYSPH